MQTLYPWMHIVGRVLFGVIFVTSGLFHLTKLNAAAAYAQSKGVPAPKLAVAVTGVMILIGGLTIILGWHRFIGAGLIFLFLFPTALVMHAFWKESDPAARQNEMNHFFKDMALAGAALFVAFYAGGEWPFSIGG